MNNLKPVPAKLCGFCKCLYQPKDGGYKSVFCTKACRLKSERARFRIEETDPDKRDLSKYYAGIKDDPIRLARMRETCAKHKQITRKWLADYKMASGCVDCGYKKHFSALQLDHEGTKSVTIADARSSIGKLQKEIKDGKCVVRCANCHAIKTWERKQKVFSNEL